MGLYIHYNGQLRKKNQLENLVNELKDVAEVMDWPFNTLDEDWKAKPTARLEEKEGGLLIYGNSGLKGIAITPHPYCEALKFYFDHNGKLSSPLLVAELNSKKSMDENSVIAVNTQFAGEATHIAIIKLLKHVGKKYLKLTVRDEGKYWQTKDADLLTEKMGETEVAWEAAAVEPIKMDREREVLLKKIDEVLK